MLLRTKSLLTKSRLLIKEKSFNKNVSLSSKSSASVYLKNKSILKRYYTVDTEYHPSQYDKKLEETLNSEPNVEGGIHDAKDGLPVSERVEKVVDEILKLSFLEIASMNKLLAKRLGIPEDVLNQMMSGGGGFGGGPSVVVQQPVQAAPAEQEAPAEEETKAPPKSSKVDIKLVKYPDANKFKVLKEVRALKPGMNLMESKALIEGLPKVIFEGATPSEAEQWKKQLEEHGCEIELV